MLCSVCIVHMPGENRVCNKLAHVLGALRNAVKYGDAKWRMKIIISKSFSTLIRNFPRAPNIHTHTHPGVRKFRRKKEIF